MSVPEGAQYSEDGNYWWDGSEWQPVDQSQSGGESGQTSQDQPMDWNEFPEIARAIHYGEDVDAYLTDLGIDPSVIDDEPEPMV